MASQIFQSLFHEKVDTFRSAFSSIAPQVFYDSNEKRIRHSGEYGTYRESIVREFLSFIVPRSLDISTGFIISSLDDVSTQCDVIIFDPKMTPLYQVGDRQRFFPMESVFCVAEVKSTISKGELGASLRKLAATKALAERVLSPVILRKKPEGPFNPKDNPYDLISSVLICQKLAFDTKNIQNELDAMYGDDIFHHHKHNLVLSLEDGVLTYVDQNNMSNPFPRLVRDDLKHRFIRPADNPYAHFDVFASSMFYLTTSKTLLFPEFTNYMGQAITGRYQDQQA